MKLSACLSGNNKANNNQQKNICFVLKNIQIYLFCVIRIDYLYSTIKNKNKPLILNNMESLKFINVELVINGLSWSKFGTNIESFNVLAKQNTPNRYYHII